MIHFESEGKTIHCFGNVVVESLNQKMIERLNQLERTVRLSPGAIYQFKMDPQGAMSMTHLSEKAFKLFGITEKEQNENPGIVMSRIHEDDGPRMLAAILKSAEELTMYKFEGRVVPVNGITKWLMAQSMPERLNDGTVLWEGVIVDITWRKQLEDQLSREQAGLGLSIDLSIVEKHGGLFYVDRNCSNTRFCIDLPQIQPEDKGAA